MADGSNEGVSANELPHRYDTKLAAKIEPYWQDRWDRDGCHHADNPTGDLAGPKSGLPRKYILDMFPYPSGKGLHVGHPLGYIATDVYARYLRMTGNNVLHTVGYDSFGLPAEQHAISTGIHPRENTEVNIANMARQLRRLGLGHDQRRAVSTTDTEFYKWTQWIFLQIFNAWYDTDQDKARPISELIAAFEEGRRQPESGRLWSEMNDVERAQEVDAHRLAYLSESPVNWCPGLGTILANEEVTQEGRSDIGNFPVFKRNMSQWMMRITKYADRLINDLEKLDWSDAVKTMQRNWIGRSSGAKIVFDSDIAPLDVFTTRADTIAGATFLVVSPQHRLALQLASDDQKDSVVRYVTDFADSQDDADKDKSGIFTGRYAINPITNKEIPIWLANYVLMDYGTGIVMGVPGGDQRDFEFARKYGLDIEAVIEPSMEWYKEVGIEPSTDASTWPSAYSGSGTYLPHPDSQVDLSNEPDIESANSVVIRWLSENGSGGAAVEYRLRDWLFSRQRYWGEPFPIVYDEQGIAHGVPEELLPVKLPEIENFAPERLDPDDEVSQPQPPLARATDWLSVELDLGEGTKKYRREINVMPQWAGSCWYELRYLDPSNSDSFCDADVEQYWMGPSAEAPCGGVDLYVGGVEHAVLHLLYARFWHKVLYDLGHVSSSEPFNRLFNQGYIQAYAYRDDRGQTVEASEVKEIAPGEFTHNGKPVAQEYGKMGKSLKNIVTPDEMYDDYGADTFRLYEMSMGPLDASRPWNSRDVIGMARFLQRVWRTMIDEETGESIVTTASMPPDLEQMLNRTIAGVTADMEEMKFNTVIAKLIELNNAATSLGGAVNMRFAESMCVMLAPLVPHFAEELWSRLGHDDSVHSQQYCIADASQLDAVKVTLVVQVNGKVRDKILVRPDITDVEASDLAMASHRILGILDGEDPKKVISKPPKVVNIVV